MMPFRVELNSFIALGFFWSVLITDACVGWDKTEELLRWAHSELSSETGC